MFTLDEQSADFYACNTEIWANLAAILEDIAPLQRDVKLPRHHVLYPAADTADKFYILKMGFLRLKREGALLFFIEPRDMVGWPLCGLENFSVFADGDVVVDEYSKPDFLERVRNDPERFRKWMGCIACQHHQYISLIGDRDDRDISVEAEVRQYRDGEIILRESALPHEVCTLREGKADILLGRHKVGEIHPGEIFGALAAITDTIRDTSIRAAGQCTVTTIPREEFLVLLKIHPETVLQLLNGLAREMNSQHRTIAELQAQMGGTVSPTD